MEAAGFLIPFAIMLLLNIPIGTCLGISSLIALVIIGIDFNMIAVNYYSASSKFVLLAIPFFILAGNIMEKAGISERLINFAQSMVGHVRNGLGMVCVAVGCFFAAISGSGPATVAALGLILIPAMVDVGYDPPIASALTATSGAIGSIIPPSITFVLYGAITGNSIGKLFMSGMIPGLLMGFLLVIATVIVTRGTELKTLPRANARERWQAFTNAFWALLMPVIILGGIYGGVFTPTEAAAVAAVYGLIVGIVIYKTVKMKELYQVFLTSISQTAVVMFITATASLFAWVISVMGIASAASNFLIATAAGNVYLFLIIVNIILLIAGCFLDGTSCFLILTPILYPAAIKLGIDPIAFGTLMVVNIAIGQVTPPVGLNLYVACGLGNVTLAQISRAVVPFVLASLISLIITSYFPKICLFLPNLIMK
ncbi:MAG: TRAP transporter large permease [Peptococcaceae bacterium]|jgi:C4-dicarboxylate transporter DctM subunit|nr:TRAP transporter large permease [Peptococcaceae bacterium]